MANISGFEVTLGADQQFHMPKACCRCGQPGEHALSSSVQVTSFGGGRRTRSVTFPYCTACFQRAKRTNSARTKLALGTIALSLGLACMALAVPALSMPLLIAVPTGLAVWAAVMLRSRAGESVEQPYGAWLTKATNKHTVFFLTKPDWAAAFAEFNKVTAAPASKANVFATWAFALIFAGGLSTLLAFLTHPPVHVDNEGPAPLQIWIDGKKSLVAQPMTGELGERPTVRVPCGKHRFGWSAVDATAPTSQTEATTIELAGDHLYNPASTACYFLDVSLYGSGATSDTQPGPIAVRELYTFKDIDNWFSENPASVSTKASHETRVAIQPIKSCYQLTKAGCSASVNVGLVSCFLEPAGATGDEAALDKCRNEAVQSCKKRK